MKPLRNFFSKTAKLLLLLSKLIFIMLSLYYICNYNIYISTINIPSSLCSFCIIDFPLMYLETEGMSLMIIALAIVIITYYYPEIRWL